MRKIIQISTVYDSFNGRYVTTALCDDGSVHYMVDDRKWYELPPIPQPVHQPRPQWNRVSTN